MAKPPMIEKRELHVIEMFINDDVTFVYMPDLNMADFHVKGDKRYVLHFREADVFGKEFAVIANGNNLFTVAEGKQTECNWFDEAELRGIVASAEASHKKSCATKKGDAVSPYTRPIIIPPARNTGAGPEDAQNRTAVKTRPIIIPPGK
ncbi:MAG: hypothetical protein LAO56_10715 [Acidobacteriia bacterium]|nr:hypothetical protein [Terriglobia bacterium]